MLNSALVSFRPEPNDEGPLRFMPVGTIGFRPKLEPHDYHHQDRFTGDGLYVLDNDGEPELFRCQLDFRGNVVVYRDDPQLGRYTFPRAKVDEMMIGRVVMTGRVVWRPPIDRVGRA